MSQVQPGSQQLAQGLRPAKSAWFGQALLVIGILVALLAATYGWTQRSAQEPVVLAARDIPMGRLISIDDLKIIELQVYRSVDVAGFQNTGLVAGQWAGRNIFAGDIVQPASLSAAAPDVPIYPNGRSLEKNMVAVPFAIQSLGPITERDVINIGISSRDIDVCPSLPEQAVLPDSEDSSYACRIMERIPILYIDPETTTAYLAMTPYQAQALQAVQVAGVVVWAERYGTTSDGLSIMTRLDATSIDPGLMRPAQP